MIDINNNIIKMEEEINSLTQKILKGRTIDELSNDELIELNNMYKAINSDLKERIEYKNGEINKLKTNIQELISNLKDKK